MVHAGEEEARINPTKPNQKLTTKRTRRAGFAADENCNFACETYETMQIFPKQMQESRAAEEEKQQRMKEERNDKARRRAAMCENLGRGC